MVFVQPEQTNTFGHLQGINDSFVHSNYDCMAITVELSLVGEQRREASLVSGSVGPIAQFKAPRLCDHTASGCWLADETRQCASDLYIRLVVANFDWI